MEHEMQFAQLDQHRRELGMSRAVVAKLAGVSEPTVTRVLTSKERAPTFPVIRAIAMALQVEIRVGDEISVDPLIDPDDCRKQRARAKAIQLVQRLQGSMGLEAQAVDSTTIDKMVDRTMIQLLAGSKRKLWED